MIICQGIKADLDQSNSKNATMFYMQFIYELRANKIHRNSTKELIDIYVFP